MLIASLLTTPLFGIPIGIIVYFLLFYKDEDFDEMAKNMIFKKETKEVAQK